MRKTISVILILIAAINIYEIIGGLVNFKFLKVLSCTFSSSYKFGFTIGYFSKFLWIYIFYNEICNLKT